MKVRCPWAKLMPDGDSVCHKAIRCPEWSFDIGCKLKYILEVEPAEEIKCPAQKAVEATGIVKPKCTVVFFEQRKLKAEFAKDLETVITEAQRMSNVATTYSSMLSALHNLIAKNRKEDDG